jgi:glycosyltransferase involved in cell wall biosynthesis
MFPLSACRMRVLLLNYEFPPLGGGAGLATASLAIHLARKGVAVDVVTTRSPGRAVGPAADASAELPEGVCIYGVRSWRRGVHQAGMSGAASYLVGALPVVRRLLRRHRYAVVHAYFSLPTGALLPVAGLRGVPAVVSLRGSDVPGYDPRLRRAHALLLPLTRRIWREADRVVVVCESLGQLARRTQPDLRYVVIENGVDVNVFRPRARGPNPADGRPLRCIAVARLIERKGLATLVEAVRIVGPEHIRLEIVGSGPAERGLRDLTARLGLERAVQFSGALERAEVAERCREADLFTLVPRQEAFGNAFAEALASGLPIIGSDVGGIPDLVRQGENGFLVPPDDPAAVARVIQRFASDPALRAAMGAVNRARAESQLSWERVAERHLELYAELSARRARAPAEVAVA